MQVRQYETHQFVASGSLGLSAHIDSVNQISRMDVRHAPNVGRVQSVETKVGPNQWGPFDAKRPYDIVTLATAPGGIWPVGH